MTKNNARIEKWYFVNPPESAYAFAEPNLGQYQLFGHTYDDSRADTEIDYFVDGHRVVTTPIKHIDLKNGVAVTKNTVYVLGKINTEFSKWLEKNSYKLETYEKAILESR